MKTIVLCLCACLTLSGCGNWDSEIRRNRRNLPEIENGMTMAEVREVMGEPVSGEVYCNPDVWFYYTDCKWSDGMINSDECTPVVFKDGVVAGRGWDYYKKNVRFKPWNRRTKLKEIKFND